MTAFNNWQLTARCLASIFKSSYPKENYEIILVNNASTDNTESLINYLVKSGEPIKHMKMERDLDYLLGTNIGWKEVQTPFLMLANNDIILHENCLDNMMKAIKSDDKIGIAGAMEYSFEGNRITQFTYLNKKDLRLGKYSVILKKDEDVKYDAFGLVDVDVAGLSCGIVRKEVSDKIGFFDELFCPCMHEQEDYCLRAKMADYRVVMAPTAKYLHAVGATTAFNPAYYYEACLKNTEKFIEKWKKIFKEDIDEKI